MNGNLKYCVERCFSGFMTTTQYLKNYLSFNFPYMLIRLITEMTEILSTSQHSPGAKIYTEILCNKVKVSIRDFEIHAKNYLKNNLYKELGVKKWSMISTLMCLTLQKLKKYITIFHRYLSPNLSQLLLLSLYKMNILKKKIFILTTVYRIQLISKN